LQETAAAALAAEVVGGALEVGAERGRRDRDDHVADRIGSLGWFLDRSIALLVGTGRGTLLSLHEDLREDGKCDLFVAHVTHVEPRRIDHPRQLLLGQTAAREGVPDDVPAGPARDETDVARRRLKRLLGGV